MVLLIDNYDSFSYNLFQLVGQINPDIEVIRNDQMTIDEIEKLNPSHIIISPGPGRPEDAGICQEAISYFAGKIPILGVCLGHQAICQAFGGQVSYAKRLMHGKMSMSSINKHCPIFEGLGDKLEVARYHSLSAVEASLPDCLEIIARSDDDGEVMAVKHKDYDLYGLQFHPESILTSRGYLILDNFLKM